MRELKWYKRLGTGKGRRESGMFLVEGERAVGLILETYPGSVDEILAVEPVPEAVSGFPLRILSEKQYRSVSSLQHSRGPCAVVRMPVDASSLSLPGEPGGSVLVLEDIQDPGNVGTLLRTAAAFGFSGAVMSEPCADPFSPRVVQASAGTVLNLWIRRTSGYLGLIDELLGRGYELAGTVPAKGQGTGPLVETERLVLALGNEGSGLSNALLNRCGSTVRIPMAEGKAESLNVAVTGGICMFLRFRSLEGHSAGGSGPGKGKTEEKRGQKRE